MMMMMMMMMIYLPFTSTEYAQKEKNVDLVFDNSWWNREQQTRLTLCTGFRRIGQSPEEFDFLLAAVKPLMVHLGSVSPSNQTSSWQSLYALLAMAIG